MSDSTKVYEGGLPMGGFDGMQKLAVSNEAESGYTPGGPANRPGTVSQGGPTQGKTYDKKASVNFLNDAGYSTLENDGFQAREAFELPMKIVNPNDISHKDSC